MDEQLMKQLKRMSLTTREMNILVKMRDPISQVNIENQYCLFGKLLTSAFFSRKGFYEALRKFWRPSKEVKFEEPGENLFFFQFSCRSDKRRVLEGSPWNFHDKLLVLKEYDENGIPSEVRFNFSPFWIHIYNLPRKWRRVESRAKELGDALGGFLEQDKSIENTGGGKTLRLRVNINIGDPIPRFVQVEVVEGKLKPFILRYEKLPSFCYNCGRLSHAMKECEEELVPEEEQYGKWIKMPQEKYLGSWSDLVNGHPAVDSRSDGNKGDRYRSSEGEGGYFRNGRGVSSRRGNGRGWSHHGGG